MNIRPLRYLSVCSGAGGMDLGLELGGGTLAGLCEIDPHARRVLAHHWPDIPCHDDITTLNGADWYGRVDLVAGGTPCTDLSMAGRRSGLDGEHSRLFWDFVRIATASAARWILWENVAGALSSNNGEDFASVLWGITGHQPAVPADGWGALGMCQGVERAAVWRVLDAQWYGVAQRRRRVFVVGCARADLRRALEVLLDPGSLPGHPRPQRPQGPPVTALTAVGTGVGGPDSAHALAGHIIPEPYEHTAFGHYTPARTATTIKTRAGDGTNTDLIAYGLELNQAPVYAAERINSLGTAGAGVLAPERRVRRLMPVECERLMGWPDDWTVAPGKPYSERHRYKMCGNGVVAPVAEWIARRLYAAHQEDQ